VEIDRDQIKNSQLRIQEFIEKPVSLGVAFLVIGSITFTIVFLGSCGLWVGLEDNDCFNPFTVGVFVMVLIFHIACLCIMRQYRKTAIASLSTMNHQFVADMNGCLSANDQISLDNFNNNIENLRLDYLANLNLGTFLYFLLPNSPFVILILGSFMLALYEMIPARPVVSPP